jgi:hypothetical protein
MKFNSYYLFYAWLLFFRMSTFKSPITIQLDNIHDNIEL